MTTARPGQTRIHVYIDAVAVSALRRLQSRGRGMDEPESAASVVRRAILALEATEAGADLYNPHLAALLRTAAERLGG